MQSKHTNALIGPASQEGAVLIVVLWILTILAVMVANFCYSIRTEANITRNTKEQLQAHYLARAGVYAAIADLIYLEKAGLLFQYETTDGVAAPEPMGAGDQEATDTAPRLRINHTNPATPFGNGHYQLYVNNLAGKVNLNRADQDLLTAMLNGFDLSDTEKATIVDSILDWRDPDDMHRLNGAEKDYYAHLDPPYPCKNGDFTAVHELLLVKGVTHDLFQNGLRDMVTVDPPDHAGLSKIKGARSNQVNLNSIPETLLKALLNDHEEALAAILEFRQSYDFKSLSELAEIIDPGAYNLIAPYLSTQLSPCYSIRSTGFSDINEFGETIEATIALAPQTALGYRMLHWKDVIYEPIRAQLGQPHEAQSE